MHDQYINEALEESLEELDWWSCEACKDWLNLAVVLDIRSERAAEMLKAMPENEEYALPSRVIVSIFESIHHSFHETLRAFYVGPFGA